MTLYELLHSVEFTDIVDSLIEIDPPAKDNIYAFKEAFDLLKNLQPAQSDHIDITIERTDYEDGNPPCISVYFKEDNSWEVMLSRNVVIIDNCISSVSDIVANILWELTFYGFSPDEIFANINKTIAPDACHANNNPYLSAFLKLQQHNHDLNFRYTEDIGKKTFTFKFASDFSWAPPRNGPKRHRERRQKQRLKELEKMINRWDLCESLISIHHLKDDKETTEKLRDTMLYNDGFHYYHMESQSKSGCEIEYMEELIRDYFPAQRGSKSIVLVSAPHRIANHPDFKYMIWESFGSFIKIPSPRGYIWCTDEERENIRIDILVFK